MHVSDRYHSLWLPRTRNFIVTVCFVLSCYDAQIKEI
jgi:hypothetical protein